MFTRLGWLVFLTCTLALLSGCTTLMLQASFSAPVHYGTAVAITLIIFFSFWLWHGGKPAGVAYGSVNGLCACSMYLVFGLLPEGALLMQMLSVFALSFVAGYAGFTANKLLESVA
ncbi:MAG: hypothetical protein K2W95_29880 [Candidatus Obscuribacterales bacterium]|nr:hypothetical protein [Candidatus Obscuribacterales bacterium]